MKKLDFKKYFFTIKENPGKLFGLVYIYIFVVGMAFGIYYVNNISAVVRQNVAPGIPDTTVHTDLKIVEAKTIPAVDLKLLQSPDQQFLEKGKNLYTTVCSSCHGESGKGNGPAGTGMAPPPRNFESADGWKNGKKIADLYKTLEEGIPGTGMISYNYMSPEERLAIALYVHNNFIPNPPAVTTEEVTSLDQTYNLSKVTEVSAQIPVQQAMNLYLSDNRNKTDKVIQSMRELSSDESDGGKIFRRIVSDKGKAVIGLAQHNEWKNDESKFRGYITSAVNRNGFNSEVYYLNENDWSILYNYLVRIF